MQPFGPRQISCLCLKSLALLVAFTTVYSVFMYALATTARPLADPTLAYIDGTMGFSAADVVGWVNARPKLEWALRLVYFSLIPQTILTIVWLGLGNQRERLDKFLVRFMLGALLTAVGFYLLPAVGTCASYDLPVNVCHQKFIEHFAALRDGSLTLVSWRNAEGLMTFPSFHTIWAVLLIAAFYRVPYASWPIALLNVAVVISTVTTGMHYLTDVLAGLLVSAIVIYSTRGVEPKKGASDAPHTRGVAGRLGAR